MFSTITGFRPSNLSFSPSLPKGLVATPQAVGLDWLTGLQARQAQDALMSFFSAILAPGAEFLTSLARGAFEQPQGDGTTYRNVWSDHFKSNGLTTQVETWDEGRRRAFESSVGRRLLEGLLEGRGGSRLAAEAVADSLLDQVSPQMQQNFSRYPGLREEAREVLSRFLAEEPPGRAVSSRDLGVSRVAFQNKARLAEIADQVLGTDDAPLARRRPGPWGRLGHRPADPQKAARRRALLSVLWSLAADPGNLARSTRSLARSLPA
jgi:hypothetical protein